jgi:hypothetical protein
MKKKKSRAPRFHVQEFHTADFFIPIHGSRCIFHADTRAEAVRRYLQENGHCVLDLWKNDLKFQRYLRVGGMNLVVEVEVNPRYTIKAGQD